MLSVACITQHKFLGARRDISQEWQHVKKSSIATVTGHELPLAQKVCAQVQDVTCSGSSAAVIANGWPISMSSSESLSVSAYKNAQLM